MSEVKDKLITAENLKNAYDDNKRAISALKGDIDGRINKNDGIIKDVNNVLIGKQSDLTPTDFVLHNVYLSGNKLIFESNTKRAYTIINSNTDSYDLVFNGTGVVVDVFQPDGNGGYFSNSFDIDSKIDIMSKNTDVYIKFYYKNGQNIDLSNIPFKLYGLSGGLIDRIKNLENESERINELDNSVENLKNGYLNFDRYGEEIDITPSGFIVGNIYTMGGRLISEDSTARAYCEWNNIEHQEFYLTITDPDVKEVVIYYKKQDNSAYAMPYILNSKVTLPDLTYKYYVKYYYTDNRDVDINDIPFKFCYASKIKELDLLSEKFENVMDLVTGEEQTIYFLDDLSEFEKGGINSSGANYNSDTAYNNSHYRSVSLIPIQEYGKYIININKKYADTGGFNIYYYSSNDASSFVRREMNLKNKEISYKKGESYFRIVVYNDSAFNFSKYYCGVILEKNIAKNIRNSSFVKEIACKNAGKGEIAQGSCTDGRYIYFLEGLDWNNPYNSVEYSKYDLENKIFETHTTSDEHHFGHANDMTYNSLTKKLYVSTVNGGEISVYDTDFNFIKSVYPKINDTIVNSYAIAYNRLNDQYIIALTDNEGYSNYDFAVFDSNWNFIKLLSPSIYSKYTRQSIETDGLYIYRLYYNKNVIDIYSMDGSYIKTITVDVLGETEALSTDYNGNFYLTTNYRGSYTGTIVYYLGLEKNITFEQAYVMLDLMKN